MFKCSSEIGQWKITALQRREVAGSHEEVEAQQEVGNPLTWMSGQEDGRGIERSWRASTVDVHGAVQTRCRPREEPRSMAAMRRCLVLAALVLCVQTTTAANILDYLWDWSDDSAGLEQRDTQTSSTVGGGGGGGDGDSLRTCSCQGPACDCCVDFNLTFIDLGGPGCVRMKYISPEDGIAVNVSYGDSLLHSESVKGANPGPTCMGMLSDLAQLCARFVDLAPTADGLRWCLQIEPTLLGEVQAEYHVGCFRMAPGGMALDPAYNYTRPAITHSTEAPDEEEAADTTEQSEEDALLAAVSESAEQGIAFFSNLLGLAVDKDQASNSSISGVSSSSTAPPIAAPVST